MQNLLNSSDSSPRTTLKLGTRRSRLAQTQSQDVARALEAAHPGLRVELVGIETRGDQIQDIPLGQIEGKEFFVAELDHALIRGEVDLCVHSLKDLSLDRPREITLGATPVRQWPHDVLILRKDAVTPPSEKAPHLRPRRIGTSSPRRLENVATCLDACGALGDPSLNQWIEIRGNVPTRLARLHDTDPSRRLEGVVLALAGLERLACSDDSVTELRALLRDTSCWVLPLSLNPSAPGQGALAVECRTDDTRTKNLLAALHDPETLRAITLERDVLRSSGGGCHQRFGASAWENHLFIRGLYPDLTSANETRILNTPARNALPDSGALIWDGSENRFFETRTRALSTAQLEALKGARALFCAHDRALTPEVESLLKSCPQDQRPVIWTSGVSSWGRLSERGFEVQGCADGFGAQSIRPLLASQTLNLPPESEWLFLTHAQSNAEFGQLLATYELVIDPKKLATARAAAQGSQHFYWASGSQFKALWPLLGDSRQKLLQTHACGLGKTADVLREAGIEPFLFRTPENWKNWMEGTC